MNAHEALTEHEGMGMECSALIPAPRQGSPSFRLARATQRAQKTNAEEQGTLQFERLGLGCNTEMKSQGLLLWEGNQETQKPGSSMQTCGKAFQAEKQAQKPRNTSVIGLQIQQQEGGGREMESQRDQTEQDLIGPRRPL